MKNVRNSLTALALLAGAWPLSAQTASTTPTQPAARTDVPVVNRLEDDEAVQLTPFEVRSTKDTGYQATETLAGTRIRTDLKDVGGALSVYTKEFLKDNPTVDVLHARPEMTPARYADFALRWVDIGATIIGGCCETTPAHIAEIARRLKAEGHRIV